MVFIVFMLLQARYHREHFVYDDQADDEEGYEEWDGGESECCVGLRKRATSVSW